MSLWGNSTLSLGLLIAYLTVGGRRSRTAFFWCIPKSEGQEFYPIEISKSGAKFIVVTVYSI